MIRDKQGQKWADLLERIFFLEKDLGVVSNHPTNVFFLKKSLLGLKTESPASLSTSTKNIQYLMKKFKKWRFGGLVLLAL